MTEKTITITEALAELKTIGKRIQSKQAFIRENVIRQENLRDPLEKQGGSPKLVSEEGQSIVDLCARVVKIRIAIQQANNSHSIRIGEWEQTIAEWLVWRREVLPFQLKYMQGLLNLIHDTRDSSGTRGRRMMNEESKIDYVVNLDENALRSEVEFIQEVEGQLDGQLSLKNATITVTV